MKKISYYAGLTWIIIASTVIAASLGFTWLEHGFSKVAEILNPFNFISYLVIGVTLLPGIALHYYGSVKDWEQSDSKADTKY